MSVLWTDVSWNYETVDKTTGFSILIVIMQNDIVK